MPDISNASRAMRSPRPVVSIAALIAVGLVSVGVAVETGSSDRDFLGAPVDLAGQPIEKLQAAPDPGLDADGDGVPDAQEIVLGLLPQTADSDGDGYNDGEELARQSNPLDYMSVPTSGGISASLTARGEGTSLRLVISIHEPAGEAGDAKVRIGAVTRQGVVSVPINRFFGLADIYTATGVDDATVTVIDVPLSANFVHANRHVTFFLAAGNFLDISYNAAAKIDVESVDGVLLLLRPLASSLQSIQGTGSIRQPIPPSANPSIPMTWVAGAICLQRSITVGGNGALVIKQVVEAECLAGWDSFCASDCSSSVGTSYRTIDPGALIGG